MISGILDAIENGVVRNTGLFVNMPESEHAASFIQDYPQVCFGIDFNIVSGDPVSDPELLPDLVDQDGHFIRSTVKMADPRFGKEELWPYEQVLTELRAQLKHFVRLAGQPPEYLHGHSVSRGSGRAGMPVISEICFAVSAARSSGEDLRSVLLSISRFA